MDGLYVKRRQYRGHMLQQEMSIFSRRQVIKKFVNHHHGLSDALIKVRLGQIQDAHVMKAHPFKFWRVVSPGVIVCSAVLLNRYESLKAYASSDYAEAHDAACPQIQQDRVGIVLVRAF